MGQLIQLDFGRAARPARTPRPTLYVDLADPVSVIALDHVDRAWPDVRVRLASREAMGLRPVVCPEAAHARAASLRERLELPLTFPCELESALRVGSRATGAGRGREFVLAAARMAYRGGYDLRSADVLAEAASCAGLDWHDTLQAMRCASWGDHVRRTSRALHGRGATQLPALRLGNQLVCGEEAVRSRLTALRHTAV